jgi:hypothetical protein
MIIYLIAADNLIWKQTGKYKNLISRYVKVKVKFTLEQTTKSQREIEV